MENSFAERAKKLYAEGDYAHAHDLGIDEHDADFAHHWHKDEAERGHTGNSKWAKGAPTMWETGSQISKHMNHHLWGEARRELMDDPLGEDMTGKRAGAALKQADWGHNKDEYKRHLVDGVEKKTGVVDHHFKDYEG